MKVIPVIDILDGKVVHAVKGKRRDYKPIQSIFTSSLVPLEVARIFKNNGFGELYIADLDAIIACLSNFHHFKQIVDKTGLELMVDAGITSLERAYKLFENGVSKLVIGTETLKKKVFVSESIRLFGKDRVIVSIDMKDDRVLVQPGFDGCTEPMCLLRELIKMGVSNVIILDLAKVGTSEGMNKDFLKKITENLELGIYTGGGVRDLHDLVELRNLGVAGALVATALHNGRITVQQLKDEGFI
jgi:phosphoribosylformimino-5-aminoimidazole carboxamide ribotide isomerase